MIDVAILACDEEFELNRLLKNLIVHCNISVENIYILFDEDKKDAKTLKVVQNYRIENIYYHSLSNDFSAHRNFIIEKCGSDYILFVDADETIPPDLINTLKYVVGRQQVDILGIPRVNKLVCNDATPATEIFGLEMINPIDGKIGWPDYQFRFMRNSPNIRWEGKLHEMIRGGQYNLLPQDEDLAIQHLKTTSKQLAQRNYYRDNF